MYPLGRQLQRMGYTVTILEARQRIGGRVLTTHALGTTVDLGAMIATGVIGNPVTCLVDQMGLAYYDLR